jgi:hypothetical protein
LPELSVGRWVERVGAGLFGQKGHPEAVVLQVEHSMCPSASLVRKLAELSLSVEPDPYPDAGAVVVVEREEQGEE